jgi:hypothetical protein
LLFFFCNNHKEVITLKLNRKVLIGTGSAAAVCALVVGVTGVSAASTGKPAGLASEIASAFHLNQSDVQKILDQHKDEMQTYRQGQGKSRLDQAVKDGKITADQETKILDEQKQIQADMQANRDKTGTDRKAAIEAERTKIEQWAKDNNIPLKYLAPFGGHRGFGPGMHGRDDGTTVSPSPSPAS